jgi:hypothetical protein
MMHVFTSQWCIYTHTHTHTHTHVCVGACGGSGSTQAVWVP